MAFAHHVMENARALWTNASADDRKALQGALFPTGLAWTVQDLEPPQLCLAFNQLPACSGVEIAAFSAESDLSSGANVLFRSSLPRAPVERLRFSYTPSKTSGDIAVSEGLRLALVI